MLQNLIRRTPRPGDVSRLTTPELREAFLLEKLFVPGALQGCFTDLDRLVVGGVMPVDHGLELANHKETGRSFFLEQREMGILNIGGHGRITADGQSFELERLDCLYLPVGTREVSFFSRNPAEPSRFYFLSCPAHSRLPMALLKSRDASPVALGSQTTSNKRVIYKLIHPGGIKSCQLVMGYTALEPGNVWNSFPPHTHCRRTEIYFYFDLQDGVVSHFMGEPQSTRHLFVHDQQGALSPNWSIHCGCGTSHYKFIWGMAGENQVFDDMDAIKPLDLQ